MKGYIYTMYKGADPSAGWEMTDPIFKGIPSMGACRPDIRKRVEKGDYIFAISGRVHAVKQHIVGGFEVDKKIDALTAYHQFPQNRMVAREGTTPLGNIIVDQDGNHVECDYHKNWENRIENYIVGTNPIYFEKPEEMNNAKEQTLDILNEVLGKDEERIFDLIGQYGKRLDEDQVKHILSWMEKLKGKL